MLSEYTSAADLKLFLNEMIHLADPEIKYYLERLDLKANGIKDRSDLILFLLKNAPEGSLDRDKMISLVLLTAVVLSYQITGGLVQWLINGSFQNSYSSFIMGIPGMLLQVIMGFAILFTLKDYEFKNDQ